MSEPQTTVGAKTILPEGTDLVKLNKMWYLVVWNDDVAIASPDADLYVNADLFDSTELLRYEPPNGYVKSLLNDLTKGEDE